MVPSVAGEMCRALNRAADGGSLLTGPGSYWLMRAYCDIFRNFQATSLKWATVGVFTPWKSATATDQGFLACVFLPLSWPQTVGLLAHHCAWAFLLCPQSSGEPLKVLSESSDMIRVAF